MATLPDHFAEIDVSAWAYGSDEPLGTKPKRWLIDPSGQLWLFKRATDNSTADGTYQKGDDWAERIAAEVARQLGIPAADVELAVIDHDDLSGPGIISRMVIAEGESLVHGNELLAEVGVQADHPKDRRGYTLGAVRNVLDRVHSPTGGPEMSAWEWFVGYLVLDALLGNTDRHQENWAVIHNGARRLSPSFDHASSLGFQLADAERVERMTTRDERRGPTFYASRARSKFEHQPHPIAVAAEGLAMVGSATRELWLARCEQLDSIKAIVGRMPTHRMSDPARSFAAAIFRANRAALLSHPFGTVAP